MAEKTKNEIAKKEETAVALSKDESALLTKFGISQESSGFDEASSFEDITMGYLRLLQKEDPDVEGTFGGCLVETVENKVLDIRKTKGAGVEVVPLYVTKDFEVYEPKYEGEGRLSNSKFGKKIKTLKRHDPYIQQHMKPENKKGTRNSYVVYNAEGKIEALFQQNNKVYVIVDGEFYCLSLRNSKVRFFNDWNTIIKNKRKKDGLPEFFHKYKLMSAMQTNELNGETFWNFEVQYAGRVSDNLEFLAKSFKEINTIFESGKEIDIVGEDDE